MKVGQSKQLFGIHRGLLLHHSQYFQKALTGSFKEATEGVTLDEDDPVTFQIFNLWLYSGKLLSEEQSNYGFKEMTMLLVNACLFADLREVPAMYNCAIDMIIRTVTNTADQGFPYECIRRVWDRTPESSKLRLLFVRLIVFETDVRKLMMDENSFRYFIRKALRDLAVAFYDCDQDPSTDDTDFWEDRCTYHMHGPDHTSCSGHLSSLNRSSCSDKSTSGDDSSSNNDSSSSDESAS